MSTKEQEEAEFLRQYEQDIAEARAAQGSGMSPYSPAMFGGGGKQNLIEWELDFKPELEDIERLLRCDVMKRDKDGNEFWVANPDDSKVFLNDLGVNDVLRKIRLLVNKNKVLSNYNPEEISKRVRMIQNELRVLIYTNYEQYGIDNEYKMNNYSMIVLTIGSLIEDAYRRAMGGSTHQGLNEQRIVQQTEPIMPQGYQMQAMPQKQGGLGKLMPWNWSKS